MLNREKYRDYLLSNIPRSKSASGGREIQCRCFYCPDSDDPRSAGHFYIGIPNGTNDLSKYYCQKCRTKGFVSHKKLIEWNIYDDTIAIDLINHNKDIKLNPKNIKYMDRDVYYLQNNFVTQDDLSAIKLRHINNRLGLNLTYQEVLDKKIVLNLNDLLKSNRVEGLTRNINIVNEIDQNFLGFISLDNAFVNMRRLCGPGKVYQSIDKRYINYSIFNKFDNSERFYTIPKNIYLGQPRRIQLHIAEGPFDILSIYYNLRNQSDDIYTCIAGNNYKGIIRHFLVTMKLPYIELHLYPDNDKFGSSYVMKDIADYCKGLQIPIYIHRNVNPKEKDFGISIDKIQEQIQRIL